MPPSKPVYLGRFQDKPSSGTWACRAIFCGLLSSCCRTERDERKEGSNSLKIYLRRGLRGPHLYTHFGPHTGQYSRDTCAFAYVGSEITRNARHETQE